MSQPISLFVNCFERDYREVLAPGFMKAKAAQFRHPFTRRVVTINNVTDCTDALTRAAEAVKRGEIDAFLEVDKMLPAALKLCGVTLRQLGPVKHYTDFALVAVVNAAPGFLLYCCAEVDLVEACDWITPALEKLSSDPKYLIANPAWGTSLAGVEREALFKSGEYFVGHGFSDQCFLVDASRLAKDVYGFSHPSGDRYPLSQMGEVFEQRVDAYMRHAGLLRLTDPRVSYLHKGAEGLGYPKLPLWRRFQRKFKSLGDRVQAELKSNIKHPSA
jgi:hypothetical protein